MLFAYNQDGTLEVVADLNDARSRFDPQDLKTGAICIYDADGKPLKPVFRPGTDRKFLGIRVGSGPEAYDLVPDDTGAAESFSSVLVDANVLMPNRWFGDLTAVRAHFGARQTAGESGRQ